jgi:hypothetical protein
MATPVAPRALLVLALLAPLAAACSDDECEMARDKCEGNVAFVCQRLYSDRYSPLAWQKRACGERTCVVARDGEGRFALCAVSAQPEPRCGAREQATACDGQEVLGCSRGFVLSRERCAGAMVCALPTAGVAFCAQSATMDPRCGTANGFATCGPGGYLVCREGFVVKEGMCPEGQRCAPGPEPTDIQCTPGP